MTLLEGGVFMVEIIAQAFRRRGNACPLAKTAAREEPLFY
jgi:hypothetical protein